MSRIGVVEIFRSVQGEGYNAGRAAIFFRTAGCNLACHFADGSVCDTPYQQANLKLELEELFEQHIIPLVGKTELRSAKDLRCSRDEDQLMFIITGGEPTMQPQFDAIAARAHDMGFYVAVETNGTKWKEGLRLCDWLCVSPKDSIQQGSPAPDHNPNPQTPQLHEKVRQHLDLWMHKASAEYRYVIGGPETSAPVFNPAFRHYLSPAVLSDGTGLEWRKAFPGFVPGALERCLELVDLDPRWRLSTQQHKQWKVR